MLTGNAGPVYGWFITLDELNEVVAWGEFPEAPQVVRANGDYLEVSPVIRLKTKV